MATERKTKKRGQNEGSIYKRADGRWCAVLNLGYENGKRQRKYLYADTRAKVADLLAEARHAQKQGIAPADARRTVAAFLADWLENTVKGSVRPRTHDDYATIVRLHLVPTVGKIVLTKLTPQDVQRMMTTKRKEGLSPRSVAHIRNILGIALAKAVRWRIVPFNAASLTEPPRVERFIPHTITPDHARAFLDTVKDTRHEALYMVALTLGLRQGELLGLRWQDVNLDAGTLTVRMQLQRGGRELVEPKTDRSRRTLALPTMTVDALKQHRKRQVEERLRAGSRWHDGDFIFPTATGTPTNARDLVRDFHQHRDAAKLPPVRFHDLRHAAASFLLAQGADMRLIMEVLGHSHIGTTANIYTHVAETVKRGAANMMDDLLTGTK